MKTDRLSTRKKCYLCGSRLANTREHLFPSCLFNKPLPTNLPTLPACSECNNALSSDEELFRVFLASGMAYETQPGFRIWNQRIRPDLKGRRPLLKSTIRSYIGKARVISESGASLGDTLVLKMDRGTINRVLCKIAKGLYYLDTGAALPKNVQILMDCANGEPERFLSPPLDEAIRGAKKVDLGNCVVTYWRNTMKDDPANSITWLMFYKDEDKLFMICTYTADTEKE